MESRNQSALSVSSDLDRNTSQLTCDGRYAPSKTLEPNHEHIFRTPPHTFSHSQVPWLLRKIQISTYPARTVKRFLFRTEKTSSFSRPALLVRADVKEQVSRSSIPSCVPMRRGRGAFGETATLSERHSKTSQWGTGSSTKSIPHCQYDTMGAVLRSGFH